MKPKAITTVAIIAALVVSCLFVARGCRLGNEYRNLKADYTEYRAVVEADHAMSLQIIAEHEQRIHAYDQQISELQEIVLDRNTQILRLSTRLDELRNAEPVYPEMEAHPLVVNLRGQVATLTDMFTLSQETITTQGKQLDAFVGKYDAQVSISEEWKKSYENEHQLRLMGEGLIKTLENKVKSTRFWGRAKTVAIVAAGGYVAYTLVKK